jgi:predicted nucleotidyltransferase
MPESIQDLPVDHVRLESLCREYHIERLAIFGSYLRGEQKPDSDLDLLVEFEPGKAPGLLRFFTLEGAFTDLFNKAVELSTPGFLHSSFREEVKQHAQPIYAR